MNRTMSVPLVDPFSRGITYLRVSVTDRCDFRCVYCMAENMTFLPRADLLSLEEVDRLWRLEQGRDVAAHQRLAACEPQLAHAQTDEGARTPFA
jgi:molybdenum cofactor biosynthesis enzyme MoaA